MSIIKLPPYILDSTLDFTFNNVTATGNLVSGNAVLGNAASANYFVGNGSMLTGLPTYASETYVNTAISNLVDTAPTTLNTLNELAAALGDDPNFATTISTSIGNKLNTSAFDSTANTWLSTKTTTNLTEGTNLYFTDSRANTAIDSKVTKAFVDNLGAVASTVTTNAQPNITSVGTLTTLSISGATNLGPASNVHITGGTSGYVLSTDGTGNLSWVAQSGGGEGGGSATLESTVDTFTANGSTTTFTLTTTPSSANLIFVNLDGVSQLKNSYSLTGNVVTLSGTPVNGAIVEITTLYASNISAPSAPAFSSGKAIVMSMVFGG